MATVTGLTATYMQGIVDDTVIGGHIDISGHLILEQHDGSTIDAGSSIPAVPSATTTVEGKIELATSAEAITGTDAVRAITPATAKAIIDALVLNGLADVTITSPVTGQVLRYNGTQWVNVTNLILVGEITATKGRFGGSSGDAVFIGDDAVFQDINLANAVGIKGIQDPHQGAIYFGSDVDTNLYRGSANQLKTDDSFVVAGTFYHGGGLSMGQGNKLGCAGFTGSGSTSGSTSPGPESGLNTSISSGTNSMTFENGHIYRVIVTYSVSDNINSGYSVSIPRLYTSGGTVLGGWVHYNGPNGHLGLYYTQVLHVKRIAGSNLTVGFGWTIQRYFSGVAGSSFLDTASVVCDDMGLVSDHTGLAAISAAI